MCSVFLRGSDWADKLRGKERALRTLIASIGPLVEECKQKHREHVIDEYRSCERALEAALQIVMMGKAKMFNPSELCLHLDALLIFYFRYTSDVDFEVGLGSVLDPCLEKLRVHFAILVCSVIFVTGCCEQAHPQLVKPRRPGTCSMPMTLWLIRATCMVRGCIELAAVGDRSFVSPCP